MLLPKTALSLHVFLFETLLKTYKDILTPEEQQSTDVCRVSGDSVLSVSHCFSQEKNSKGKKIVKTSTTPSCSGPIPAQQSRGNSVLGVVFSHRMPKMDFLIIPIGLVGKKHTQLIYHMSWLYEYPPLPFHRSYKN